MHLIRSFLIFLDAKRQQHETLHTGIMYLNKRCEKVYAMTYPPIFVVVSAIALLIVAIPFAQQQNVLYGS
jgi:hypothetical protein